MKENIIEIINLNYKNIFINFNVNFEKNKFITISGTNNCGKTILMRILNKEINISNTISINNKKIENYKAVELSNIIQCVIPKEISFIFKTVEDELYFYLNQTKLSKEDKKILYKELLKNLKLTKYQNSSPNNLEEQQLIKLQLAIALCKVPQIILIDNIGSYLYKKEMLEIINYLRVYQKKYYTTIIMTTNNLNEAALSDYIYIINDSQIVLEGEPFEILQKDNILNKVGLNIPFMMDLSVKLRDYDVVKEIELDMDRMVEVLWK